MELIEKRTTFSKVVELFKNIFLMITILVLFLLNDEYNTLKSILVLISGILFLLDGLLMFSKQRGTSLINVFAGIFLILILIFL